MYKAPLSVMACAALTCAACGPKPDPAPTPRRGAPTADPRPADTHPADNRPADTGPRSRRADTVQITAAEAKTKGLTPVGFSLSTSGASWVVSRYPRKSVYLRLSGPPGGPLTFSVHTLFLNPKRSVPPLRYFVEDTFRKPHDQPLQIAKTTKLTVAGKPRDAIAFTSGKSMARTAWCALEMTTTTTPMRHFTLLFGHGARKGQPSCADIAKHPSLTPVLQSFRLLP